MPSVEAVFSPFVQPKRSPTRNSIGLFQTVRNDNLFIAISGVPYHLLPFHLRRCKFTVVDCPLTHRMSIQKRRINDKLSSFYEQLLNVARYCLQAADELWYLSKFFVHHSWILSWIARGSQQEQGPWKGRLSKWWPIIMRDFLKIRTLIETRQSERSYNFRKPEHTLTLDSATFTQRWLRSNTIRSDPIEFDNQASDYAVERRNIHPSRPKWMKAW